MPLKPLTNETIEAEMRDWVHFLEVYRAGSGKVSWWELRKTA
jgi:hypothetical protein